MKSVTQRSLCLTSSGSVWTFRHNESIKIKSSLITKGNFLRPMYVGGARNNKNNSVDREGRGHAQGQRTTLQIWGSCSLRKQPTFLDATGGFPAECSLRNERRNSILMTCHYPTTTKKQQILLKIGKYYPNLGSASDWLEIWFIQSEALPRTTQDRVVRSHQYGISALVSQASFRGETSDGVAKR